MVALNQTTLGAINNAVVEELQKRDILPVNDPASLDNHGITQRLAEHLHAVLEANSFQGDARAEANEKSETNSSATLTASINALRKKVGKSDVSEALVKEAVNAGWEKAISEGKAQAQQEQPEGNARRTLREVGDNLGITIPEPAGIGAARFQ